MLNKEKYREEIIKFALKGDRYGVSEANKLLVACGSILCEDCIFYDGDCDLGRKAWLNSKYEEPKRVFTDEQKNFIRTCDKIKFLARDYSGKLFAYSEKPYRDSSVWIGSVVGYVPSLTFITFFPQIKWSDKEPTSREEILGE